MTTKNMAVRTHAEMASAIKKNSVNIAEAQKSFLAMLDDFSSSTKIDSKKWVEPPLKSKMKTASKLGSKEGRKPRSLEKAPKKVEDTRSRKEEDTPSKKKADPLHSILKKWDTEVEGGAGPSV